MTRDADEEERRWLRARDADPAAPAPTPELEREYAEMEDMLGDLTPVAPITDREQNEMLDYARERFERRRGRIVFAICAALVLAILGAVIGGLS